MLTFLMTYVVPQFADLYSSLNAQTAGNNGLHAECWPRHPELLYLILTGLLALAIIIALWVRSERGSKSLDALRYRLPLFGEIWMKYQIAMFSRTLSTLLTGGLPLVPSLETASHSINSFKISSNVWIRFQSRAGRPSLSYSLEETKFFPDLAIEMIEVGESTGALPAMLELGGGILRGRRTEFTRYRYAVG